MKSFCNWKNRLIANNESETAVTARRNGRINFIESGELLHQKKLLLKMKSELSELCRNETRCLKENKITILRNEKAMIRAICGVTLSIGVAKNL